MKKLFFSMVVAVFFFGVLSGVYADQRADEIMNKVQKQVLAPMSFSCVQMEIFTKSGKVDKKVIFKRAYYYGIETDSKTEKLLIDVVYPPNRRKTKYFLTENEKGEEKREVVWLTSLKWPRTINSWGEDELEGSHIFYRDLLDHTWERRVYKFVQQQGKFYTIDGILDADPVYGRINLKLEEVSPGIFVYNTIYFFDKNGQLWKRENYSEFRLVWGIYYRPAKIVTENFKKGEKTILTLKNWEIRPIKEGDLLFFDETTFKKEQTLPVECSESTFR